MTSQTPQWQCISQCGACCRLAPEERAEALEALNDADQATYLSMVGADGWCIHYDSGGRRCRIYEDRPRFCRVSSMVQLSTLPPISWMPSPSTAASSRSARFTAVAAKSCVGSIALNADGMAEFHG